MQVVDVQTANVRPYRSVTAANEKCLNSCLTGPFASLAGVYEWLDWLQEESNNEDVYRTVWRKAEKSIGRDCASIATSTFLG